MTVKELKEILGAYDDDLMVGIYTKESEVDGELTEVYLDRVVFSGDDED